MFARFFAYAALCACVITTSRSQPEASILVEVASNSSDVEYVEKRYTPELLKDLDLVKTDALLLFTEFTGEAGSGLKRFIQNISSFTQDTENTMDEGLLTNAPSLCRRIFEKTLKKIEYDVHRAASFSGENHHKYFLGPMVVIRMHITKGEDYIKRCQELVKKCGLPCESTPRMKRFRRLALSELNRVKDDIIQTRKMYKDLLVHSRRRMLHLQRHARDRAAAALLQLTHCSQTNKR